MWFIKRDPSSHKLIIHIKSLLHNMKNNVAEHYYSIVCKFVGCKRMNYSGKYSYQSRCEAAVISFNKSRKYYGVLHKAMTSTSPSIFTKEYIGKIRKRNLIYAKLSNERKARPQELRVQKGFALPDKDYRNIDESIPDMNHNKYVSEKNYFLNKLRASQEEIYELKKTKDQSTFILWMEERQKMITASNFGKICKMKSNTRSINTIEDLSYKKSKDIF
ncbi:hypothetical protein JTB14_027068 [Gonioctena quinquepunctata]|nr:hypothetical protein JTB14_027068 [Gonioctena quinquepunctata]